MASLETLPKWPIRAMGSTQSNTYMPLIYSVSDDFIVQFPPTYKDVFDRSIQAANAELGDMGMTLPFANFDEFQQILKGSLGTIIGTTRMKDQNERFFDHPYHLMGPVQERIINGVIGVTPDAALPMEVLMGILIPNLSSTLRGEVCILRNRPIRQELKKWHWIDADDGFSFATPFSDEESDQIQESTTPITIKPKGSKDFFTIDKKQGTQTNNRTKFSRSIEFMGGRRRRRRTKNRRKNRIQTRFATFKQSSTKKNSSI